MIVLNTTYKIRTVWTSKALGPCPLKSHLSVEKWGAKRAAARLGGNSNNSNCSPRYLNSNNLASNSNTNYAGSAKVFSYFILGALHQSREGRNYKTSPLYSRIDGVYKREREWVSVSNLN